MRLYIPAIYFVIFRRGEIQLFLLLILFRFISRQKSKSIFIRSTSLYCATGNMQLYVSSVYFMVLCDRKSHCVSQPFYSIQLHFPTVCFAVFCARGKCNCYSPWYSAIFRSRKNTIVVVLFLVASVSPPGKHTFVFSQNLFRHMLPQKMFVIFRKREIQLYLPPGKCHRNLS